MPRSVPAGRLLSLAILLTFLATGLAGDFAPPVRAQEDRDWKNLTLLYLSDIKGKVEPCG